MVNVHLAQLDITVQKKMQPQLNLLHQQTKESTHLHCQLTIKQLHLVITG